MTKPIQRSLPGWQWFAVYWLPVIALCAVIFYQSSFAAPQVIPTWPMSDKCLHAVIFAVLAALIYRALHNSPGPWQQRKRLLLIISMLAAALYGLSDEWHQSFVPERSAEAADWLADTVGAVLGSLVCYYGNLRRSCSQREQL